MERAILRALVAIIIAAALLYSADYCALRFQIPHGRPQFGQIKVNVLYVIHVKGGKIQYEPGPPETDPCVNSLFPHFGSNPCWYATRHPDKLIDI